ncbi:MAG TPA: SprT-like domain-containing protein [Vicingaceae bacterium]|jgi:hypothetical protein|nr:SprT-like domain-containing protein [Vicingaceae bacterium]
MKDNYLAILSDFVPEKSLPILKEWFKNITFRLIISKERQTKLGDFRGQVGKISRITVNHNLNQYAFLITLTHEFAHLLIWNKHQNKVSPHGKEWKKTFSDLLYELLQHQVFPTELIPAIRQHALNPKASSSADVSLTKELNKFNTHNSLPHLMDIEVGSLFSIRNNSRIFKKLEKKRTRYLCLEVKTQKKYLINGIAEVKVISHSLFPN